MTTVSSTSSSTTSTTSTVASSTATTEPSDIDWNALIEVAVQAKLSKADTIDLKITANEAKIAAYQQLQSLLSDVADAADALRAVSGTSNSSTDVFLDRAAYLTANGDVDAASAMSATVEDGSHIGSYDIQILQLAKAHKVAGSAQTSKTEDLGLSGVVSLGVVNGEAVELAITPTMSLAEIAEAINARVGETGVQATVLRVSSTSYRLVLSSVDTGQTIVAETVSGDDVLGSLGLTDAEGGFVDVLQAAQDAILTVDGITVTRDSNTVDDLIEGVTLHLYQTTQADPGTTSNVSITLEVGKDVSSAKSAVLSLVEAYNAFRSFVAAQQTLGSNGTASAEAVLFGDGTLRSATLAVYTALTKTIGNDSMALIGLSFVSDGTLVVSEDTLDNALLNDLDAVETLLSFQMSASSSELKLLSRGTGLPADFTLDISVDASGAPSAASVGGDSSLFTVSGARIIGAKGSIYEGYTFVFTGSSAGSIDISLTTGIAELLYNATKPLADSTSGQLQTLIDNLNQVDEGLQSKSDAIRSAAETYRTNLSARYARYQAAIAAAQATQDYLTALIDQWNASS